MHTQRWQFNPDKLIVGTLFPLTMVLITQATSLPVNAQAMRSKTTVFGEVNRFPTRDRVIYNNSFPGSPSGYVNPGFYPGADYYSYPTNRRVLPRQQTVIVDPANGVVYQDSNRFIYNNPFGSNNPGYPSPNYYPYPSPNPVLVNPSIRNSTLINPVIINPRNR